MDEASVNEHLICTICSEPFIDPVVTPCDHTFCKSCIETWISEKSECCTCRNALSVDKLHPASKLIRGMVDTLLVRCLACDMKNIERDNFDDHLKEHCHNHTLKCVANDLKCPWTGFRGELEAHQSACAFQSLRPLFTDILLRINQLEEGNRSLQSENQKLKEQLNRHEQNCGQSAAERIHNEENPRPSPPDPANSNCFRCGKPGHHAAECQKELRKSPSADNNDHPRASPSPNVQRVCAEDPNRPRRPLSAFVLFSQDERPEIQKKNPSMPIRDICEEIASKWRQRSDDVKKRYEEKAAVEKQKYEQRLAEYQKNAGGGGDSRVAAAAKSKFSEEGNEDDNEE